MGMISKFSMDKKSLSLFTKENIEQMEEHIDNHNKYLISLRLMFLENQLKHQWSFLEKAYVEKNVTQLYTHTKNILNVEKEIEEIKTKNYTYGCFSFDEFKDVFESLLKYGCVNDTWYSFSEHLKMFSKYVCQEEFSLEVITEDMNIQAIFTFKNGESKCIKKEYIPEEN